MGRRSQPAGPPRWCDQPEGDPALDGDMLRQFSDTKELKSIVRLGRFELQPALDPNIASEPQRRQECFVKGRASARLRTSGQCDRTASASVVLTAAGL